MPTLTRLRSRRAYILERAEQCVKGERAVDVDWVIQEAKCRSIPLPRFLNADSTGVRGVWDGDVWQRAVFEQTRQ